jgi:hypothetical protein
MYPSVPETGFQNQMESVKTMEPEKKKSDGMDLNTCFIVIS